MSNSSIVARYRYRKADGRLLFEVLRTAPKGFRLVGPKGAALADFPRPLVLYRLPELLAADPSLTVYVAEGEKDADRLAALGLVAVTNPGGTHLGWQSHYSEWLRDRHVAILPDADGPGGRHAAGVSAALRGLAASTVIVALPGLGGAQDVSDWLVHSPARGVAELHAQVVKARFAASGLGHRPHKYERVDLILGTSLPTAAKLLLLVLLEDCRGGENAPLVIAHLAERLTMHRVTCQNLVRDLRRRAILDRASSGRKHVYTIAWDILAVLQRPDVVAERVAAQAQRLQRSAPAPSALDDLDS